MLVWDLEHPTVSAWLPSTRPPARPRRSGPPGHAAPETAWRFRTRTCSIMPRDETATPIVRRWPSSRLGVTVRRFSSDGLLLAPTGPLSDVERSLILSLPSLAGRGRPEGCFGSPTFSGGIMSQAELSRDDVGTIEALFATSAERFAAGDFAGWASLYAEDG